MKSTELRQLIRESINEYIREIDEAGNVAALEAKMTKTQEAIELREKKINMEGIDEAYHDMLDKGKLKELTNEVKALKKSLTKYEKQLEKLKSKGEKKSPELENKEIVDEVDIDETFPESGAQLEENENDNLNSMSDYELMSHAEDEGMEDMIVRDGEGGLANREEIIAALSEGNNLSSTNQIYEMLLMQKRAGILTESKYIAKLAEAKKKL
jgi:predicted transcriptional regulator